MFEDGNAYYEKIMMRRKNGKVFSNVQEINILDLTKLSNAKKIDSPKHLWGQLLKAREWEELEMLSKKSEEMKQATQKLHLLSQDENAWAQAVSRENAEFDFRLREHARKEEEKKREERLKKLTEKANMAKEEANAAKEEARLAREKIQEAKFETAKNLLAIGISIDDVSKGTGISIGELNAYFH